ncbi:unnamed protein product [Colias eurytheme]|nr:unnamed protein product [Colias eurytheme]
MAENQRKRKLSATNSQTRQVLRLNSPSFEEEFNALMLASDQSDSEGDCDDKREIPSQFQPQKNREIQSVLFGFTKEKTLCSYVPKKK